MAQLWAKNGLPERAGFGKPSRDEERVTESKGSLCVSMGPVLESSWAGPSSDRWAHDFVPSEATNHKRDFSVWSQPRATASQGKCLPVPKLSSTTQVSLTGS